MPRVAPEDIREFALENDQARLSFLNLGAIMRGWWVKRPEGDLPVVLGFDDPKDYLMDRCFLGAIVGRIANRTGAGRLELDGAIYALTTNEGAHHLHGGSGGLHARLWDVSRNKKANTLQFRYLSKHGEEGYPGQARFEVTVSLAGPVVTWEMTAQVDRPTPINLAQHNYYNLLGQGPIWSHALCLDANQSTPADEDMIPHGDIVDIADTGLDFSRPRSLENADPLHVGTDANYILSGGKAIELSAPNGLKLTMTTDQPCLQFYTAGALDQMPGAHPGQSIEPFHAVCLEPQAHPNAVNVPSFPPIIVTPDAPYRQTLSVEIS